MYLERFFCLEKFFFRLKFFKFVPIFTTLSIKSISLDDENIFFLYLKSVL